MEDLGLHMQTPPEIGFGQKTQQLCVELVARRV